MFGDWRCLRNQFFKVVRVNARRWNGPMGIEYQVRKLALRRWCGAVVVAQLVEWLLTAQEIASHRQSIFTVNSF